MQIISKAANNQESRGGNNKSEVDLGRTFSNVSK